VLAVVTIVAMQGIEYQMQRAWNAELIRGCEDVIRAELYTMRSCIDQHLTDKGHYPGSLEALVDEGYLRAIPVDPFTGTDAGAREEIPVVPTEPEVFREEHGDNHQILGVRYANKLIVGTDGTPIHGW